MMSDRPSMQALSILPQLEKLDEQPVSAEEVSVARHLYPDLPTAPPSPVPAACASSSYGVFTACNQHHGQCICTACWIRGDASLNA